MLKKTLILFLFFSTYIQAQYTIKGKMQPADNYSWIAVYKLKGAKQDYVTNTKVTNGEFSFTMPKEQTSGIYRLIYNLQSRLFVDIIYDNENIEFTFNPNYPNQAIEFLASDNNRIYHDYLKKSTEPQQKLDSLQIAYFNSGDQASTDQIKQLYQKKHTELKSIQSYYEQLGKGKIVGDFIKASARYNAEEPLSKPIDYLTTIKAHFFDHIDFTNNVLLNSTFLNDKINDYIFYINTSDNEEMHTKLQKEAISTVLDKIGLNTPLAKDIQEGLLYTFAQQENITMANFVLNNYLKLPKELQDIGFVDDIKGQLKTAIGMKVPSISWNENGAEKNLYELTDHTNYVVIFWSSTCSHCLKEMPVLHDFLKDKTSIKVIAVGLENDDSKTDWQTEITKYPDFINVYGDNKWKNKFARAYGVNATPSYFVVDSSKKIIAKPDNVEELKIFFSKK